MGNNNLHHSTEKGLISIVIPIYGNFDPRRTILTVESVMAQKKANIEVVVSEQGDLPKLKYKIPKEVKYVFTKHNPSPELSDFNPGLIRNLAIVRSSGEFVYTNDADVLFIDENFLANGVEILEKDPSLILHRPPMRRLPLNNFEEFWNLFNELGIRHTIEGLDFSQKYLATTDRKKRKLKIVKKESEYYLKTFTTSIESFEKYISDSSLKGKEPTIWTEDLHCGGNLFRRTHFEAIGRYCQEFINWGCEDSDLQWKFMKSFSLGFFPYEKKFEVLHLDHPKGYFSADMWKRNEAIEHERRSKGVSYAIRGDKNAKK